MKKSTKKVLKSVVKAAKAVAVDPKTRKPTKAEIAAADEFMARTKGQRPFSNLPSAKVGKNGKADTKIDPKNLGNALTKANESAGSMALRRMTKANAKSDPAGAKASVPVVAKAKNGRAKAAPISGQIVASDEAMKAGIDGLRLKNGSARHQLMSALLKSKSGLAFAECEKVVGDQVTQAIRVLRIVGHVAAE